MGKKVAVLVSAMMLACALPTLAWGEETPDSTAGEDVVNTALDSPAPAFTQEPQSEASGPDADIAVSVKADQVGVIATTETADESLVGMPSFVVQVQNGTSRMMFRVKLVGAYSGCNKLEVHVKPGKNSAGASKTFEVKRNESDGMFFFMSDMFNIGDDWSDQVYQGDFVITLVPSKTANTPSAPADQPTTSESAGSDTGTTSDTGAILDTGATSPKTGLGSGTTAIISFGLLVAGAAAAAGAARLRFVARS